MEVARFLKSKNPHSMVEVNLQSGDGLRWLLGRGVSDAPQTPPDRPRLRDRQAPALSRESCSAVMGHNNI